MAESPEDNIEIDVSLVKNMERLQEQLRDCGDLAVTRIKTAGGRDVNVLFIDGLVDYDLIQRDVLPTLLKLKNIDSEAFKDNRVFPVIRYERILILEEAVDKIFRGSTVVLIDGLDYAFSFELQRIEARPIEEPTTERILKGHHDGFVESASRNIAIVRSKISSSKLKVKKLTIGKRSRSVVAILYMEDIANPEIIGRVEERLNKIEFDNIGAAGTIEQLISDNPFSIFPQHQATERPDKAIANLLEGRIVLLIDSTPVSLILPVDYFQFYQTPDDYNVNFYFGSFLRLLRFIGSAIAVVLPALYIAILTFHYQTIPLDLLVPLAESRSRVPFPPIIEALIMEVSFELLREASIRLPSTLGPTIGIVGGLVLGQTAVQAGIVSNIMVVIVGITAIATFVVPQYDMGLILRVSRFIYMINAALFGVVGVAIYFLLSMAHLVSLESYGQPYLQPIAPFKAKDLKDIFIRGPLTSYSLRPDIARPKDKTRGRGYTGDKQ
ncbi:spore germination protein [Sporobacter termitidis]|uniref:spore germination protein n=1 Tax=Sporobacter termitidis TaxID=44749 RepID=UPI00135664E9|nr:spore germination protein [Sporobacter termitidis]